MTALRIELKRGPGAYVAPLLVLAGLVSANSAVTSWRVWTYATQGIAASVQLMGPVAGGVAAWAAARGPRRNTLVSERLAARPPYAAAVVEMSALLLWTLAAFLVLVLGLAGRASIGADWGGPSIPWILAAMLGLLLHVVVGYVLGRCCPLLFLPLLIAVALFLIGTYNLGNNRRWWYFLAPVNSQLWLPYDSLNGAIFGWQLLWYSGVAAVLCGALMAGTIRPRRPTLRTVLTLVAGLTTSLVAIAGIHAQHARFWLLNTKIEWQCANSVPEVCVHPAYVSQQRRLIGYFESAGRHVGGTPFAFSRVEQRPRGIGSQTADGVVAFALDDPDEGDLQDSVVAGVANALGADPACYEGAQPGQIARAQIVVAWVADAPSVFEAVDQGTQHDATWFAALSEPDKRRWLTRHAAEVRSCRLQAEDFR